MNIDEIPFALTWDRKPKESRYRDGKLRIKAGEKTDIFRDPRSRSESLNAPRVLFEPDECFLLSSKVRVDFVSDFDAGVLLVYGDGDCWAKLCFELSPQKQPTVVTVVNKGISDDGNHVAISGNHVYLRTAGLGNGSFAFHYSVDSETWQLVRYFSLTFEGRFRIGFSAQSPTGRSCTAVFSDICYQPRSLRDVRSGE